MRAEHLKGWLNGEVGGEPEDGPANVGAGADWEALVPTYVAQPRLGRKSK